MTDDIRVARVTVRVYRCPLERPVVASFGAMHNRPMVLVEVEDRSGARGWGEAWCNFPTVGAEHRARLIDSVLAPLLTAQAFDTPASACRHLVARTEVLALQSAEPGPFAQAIAGIDTALWDLAARRAGLPLWKLMNADGAPEIPVYASGLNPDGPAALAAARRGDGHAAFKLKVGFGTARDLANLRALREALGDGVRLMVDANQAWDLETARALLPQLAPFALDWLEEPLRADRPWDEWLVLKSETAIPLAAGENLAGDRAFDDALAAGALGVVQPDLAKWGGLTFCLPVARRILAAGRRYCPHYLGGGIGLLASAHLLAAAGGDGLLEIDSNPNELREMLCAPLRRIERGRATLGDAPGLGIEPDLPALERYLVRH